VKVSFSTVTSMIVKPFFSVGFRASSMPISWDGVDSMLRNADGNGKSPVPNDIRQPQPVSAE
jgi:hypothetical protein